MNKIIENLNKKGTYYRFIGLMECNKIKNVNDEIINVIRELKKDNSKIAGYTISEISIATLDLLGIEKYKGNNENIVLLIESGIDV